MKHFPSFLQPGHTVRPFFVIRRINELDTRSFTQEKLLIINIHGLFPLHSLARDLPIDQTDRNLKDREGFHCRNEARLGRWTSSTQIDGLLLIGEH